MTFSKWYDSILSPKVPIAATVIMGGIVPTTDSNTASHSILLRAAQKGKVIPEELPFYRNSFILS